MDINIIRFVILSLLWYERITGAERALVTGTRQLLNGFQGCGCLLQAAAAPSCSSVLPQSWVSPRVRAGSDVLGVGCGSGDSQLCMQVCTAELLLVLCLFCLLHKWGKKGQCQCARLSVSAYYVKSYRMHRIWQREVMSLKGCNLKTEFSRPKASCSHVASNGVEELTSDGLKTVSQPSSAMLNVHQPYPQLEQKLSETLLFQVG